MFESEEEIAGNDGRAVDRANHAGSGQREVNEFDAGDGCVAGYRGDGEQLAEIGGVVAQNQRPGDLQGVVGALKGYVELHAMDAIGRARGFGLRS